MAMLCGTKKNLPPPNVAGGRDTRLRIYRAPHSLGGDALFLGPWYHATNERAKLP